MSRYKRDFAALSDGISEVQSGFQTVLAEASSDGNLAHDIKATKDYLATIPGTILGLGYLASRTHRGSRLHELYKKLIRETEKSQALLLEHLELLRQDEARKDVRERDFNTTHHQNMDIPETSHETGRAMIMEEGCVTGAMAMTYAKRDRPERMHGKA